MSGPKQLQNLIATSRNLNSSNVPLETIILDASGVQVTSFGSGGTQYTEGDQDATITGTALVLEKPSSNQLEAAQGSTAAPAADVFGLVVRTAGIVRVINSTATDLLTAARVYTSSGAGVDGSTTTQSTGSVIGLNVREIQPSGRQSTSILVNNQTGGGSTTLISSGALSQRVYAFSVMTTIAGISSCAFTSSLGTAEQWGLILGSGSSGITGANLAVTPPGFLFESRASNPLGFTASSTGLYRVSIAWFTEA